MILGMQLLAAAVFVTDEFCPALIEGVVGEPQFCRVHHTQEISTPFFSITVEPDFLVGVDREGRRLQVQPSIRQSPVVLTVERIDGASPPNWADCPKITETVEAATTWHECRKSEGGIHERRLLVKLKKGYVLIEYSYSTMGTPLAPALERMTQSIRVQEIADGPQASAAPR